MDFRPVSRKHLFLIVSITALGATLASGCNKSEETPPGVGKPSSAPPIVNATTPNVELTPLIKAVQSGGLSEVKSQISGGADVNGAAPNGTTPLMHATSVEVAQFLLDKGAKVDATDQLGRTALDYAAGDNDRMLGRGAPGPAASGAASSQDKGADLVKLLLKHHADPNAASKDGTTPLMTVIVRRKILSGPQDFSGSEQARVAKVQALLAAGANVNAATKMETPDHLSAGATPLMALAMEANEDPALAKILLDKGADVNAKDQDGNTALIAAARKGYAGLVQILIEHKADVNVRNNQGATALSQASRMKSSGLLKCVDLLTKAGAKG